MFDFVVLDISYIEWSKLESNELLNWMPLYEPYTGELNPFFNDAYKYRKIRPDYIAKYRGLTFERYTQKNPKIEIRGSLHYYLNKDEHNYNDYTIEDHKTVLKDLYDKFGVVPSLTRIRHIEICILVLLEKYTTEQVISNILVHSLKGARIERYCNEKKTTKALFKRLTRTRYVIKVYSKSLQFKLLYELFKFEVKYFRMKDLQDLGLNYLSDTLDMAVLKRLGNDLAQKWKDTLLYDWTIEDSKLSKKEKNLIKDFRNPNYWMQLPNKRNALSRQKKKYKEIESKHSEHVHDFILQEIRKKWCKITISESNK